MKRRIIMLLAVVISIGVLAAYKYQEKINREKEYVVSDLVVSALNIAHYDKKKIDDDFSQKVFDMYLERLDYTKKFLLKEDVEALKHYRNSIDDELKAHSTDFFELSVKLINKRQSEAEAYYQEILVKPIYSSKYNLESFCKESKASNYFKSLWEKILNNVSQRRRQIIEEEMVSLRPLLKSEIEKVIGDFLDYIKLEI